jgi:nucleoside-diphosphate-sugar epimerase
MKWKNKTVLVTGGAGLVGSRVASKLSLLGADVIILDNFTAYPFDQVDHFQIENLENVHIIKGDIVDPRIVRNTMKRADVVFHLAAFADVAASIWNPAEDFHSNIMGTFNLLSLAKKENVERFIFASSASVYGDRPRSGKTPAKFSESDKPDPLSTYANSKLWGEKECFLFYYLYGLKTTSLRYFSIYGIPQVPKKNSHSWCVAIFAMKLLKGKRITIFGDGCQVRDFVYVDDIADATVLAAEKKSTIGKVVNIGSGIPTSILKVAEILNNMKAGPKKPFQFLPRPKGDPVGGYADIRLMKKLLNWEPRIKIDEGIIRYWKWASSNAQIIPNWI